MRTASIRRTTYRRLVEEMVSSKSDIVIGSRFVNGNETNQKIPAYRKFGMKVLDSATVAGSGLKVSDSQSGFRAYSKKRRRAASASTKAAWAPGRRY